MKQSICRAAILVAVLAAVSVLAGCDGGIKGDVAADVHKSMEKSGSGKAPVSGEQIRQGAEGQRGRPN